ncbi:MAG: hypothetical protein AAFU79_27885 [Myxococcota bacterium]
MKGFADQVAEFPVVEHDDDIDAMTQALSSIWLPGEEKEAKHRFVEGLAGLY